MLIKIFTLLADVSAMRIMESLQIITNVVTHINRNNDMAVLGIRYSQRHFLLWFLPVYKLE